MKKSNEKQIVIDRNVEAVRQKLLDRSQIGIAKYHCTTDRTDIYLVGWLEHLQQELMDGAIYAQAAMAAHSDVSTLEQESKQVRARLARVESERDSLDSAIRATIEDNLHLADGDNCTLIKLKRALERILL